MNAFVDLLRGYFAEVSAGGPQQKTFRIAGRKVAMKFAHARHVDQFTKALTHLHAPEAPADLTLSVWDGERPAANHLLRAYLFTLTNWWYDYTGPRGQLLDVHGGDVSAFYDPLAGLLTAYESGSKSGFLWKRDTEQMPYFEVCAPARVAMHAWLRSEGMQMVHGAAIGTESGGVLLVGPGGSGKSTSALACLDSSLSYLSDDYCVVARQGSEFQVHTLYGAAKLVGEIDLARFPELAVWNRPADGEKAAMFLHEQRREKWIEQFPLKAILVPAVTGEQGTSIESCTKAQALEALAPSTMAQMPASGAEDLAFLAEMVRTLPCYRLRAGTELAGIPRAVEGLLAGLSAYANA
jgi:hypothetical protein